MRIARRAITYGDRPDLAGTDRPEDKALPSKGVGLLFMSVQGSLHNFEKIQEWINDPNFARPFTGVDALIGSDERRRRQTWPAADGGSARLSVSDFVTLRGGEYFFVPSLDFLKNMAGPI